MLGIDGKVKNTYKEGDKVDVHLDTQRTVKGTIRGCVKEDVIDVWIVEFDEGSPHPETYPYSCAGLPHIMLSRA